MEASFEHPGYVLLYDISDPATHEISINLTGKDVVAAEVGIQGGKTIADGTSERTIENRFV